PWMRDGGYNDPIRYSARSLRRAGRSPSWTLHSEAMTIEFTGKIWYWKGPAPFYFVTVPAKPSQNVKAISGLVTYGWGVIPVRARIGDTEWTTSLFPKEGHYLVPVKASVRLAEKVEEGSNVMVR